MPSRRLLGWTLAAFAVLAVLAAIRARDWSYGADTGTFVQIVLDALGPMHDGVEGTTHYRYHWSPTLVLLWPALAATHSLWVLQTILAAATVACAPLLAALAARRTSKRVAERIGLVALLYPPLAAVGFGEFRDLGLLPVLALAWRLALEARAWTWVAVLALLLAGLREDVCLELALTGAAFALAALARRDRAQSLAAGISALAGVVSAAIYAGLVLPRLGPWPPSHFYDYPFAHGPLTLLAAPLTHPLAFAAAILTVGRFTYVLEAFVPLLLVPFRSRLLLTALPGFAIVLLANSGLVWRMGMHYAALWIPWVLLAFAAAIATLRLQRRWAAIVLAVCAVWLVAFNPLHPLHYLRPSYHALGDARSALACVPQAATPATHDEWYTAVAARRAGATVLGDVLPRTEYLVVAGDYPNDAFRKQVLPQVRRAVQSGEYRELCRYDAVTAYRRVGR
ncbi:MAG: DUF2079 domain-containing protein [Candidatus Eremiobacteraeota bacterium]|nr:DUF2079 domain-containing protein [Candidatus Eremiobacteraeota bacterium]